MKMTQSRSEYQTNRRRIQRSLRFFSLAHLAHRLGYKLLQDGSNFKLLWESDGQKRGISGLSFNEALDLIATVILERIERA